MKKSQNMSSTILSFVFLALCFTNSAWGACDERKYKRCMMTKIKGEAVGYSIKPLGYMKRVNYTMAKHMCKDWANYTQCMGGVAQRDECIVAAFRGSDYGTEIDTICGNDRYLHLFACVNQNLQQYLGGPGCGFDTPGKSFSGGCESIKAAGRCVVEKVTATCGKELPSGVRRFMLYMVRAFEGSCAFAN